MKYAHFADLHLGSWRDEKMRDLSTKAFLLGMDECIQNKVDFILFAGDLFNTSLPSLDCLKLVTKKLKELKDHNIPVYIIAGSHDFSPTGKTMIDVLENAGLLINVCKGEINQETRQLHLKFTTDQKTGAKITGILGRKGMLDQAYYDSLERSSLEQEAGYKIFMFHTAVTELMNTDLAMIDTVPLSYFPKMFNYYAGGHIHHPKKVETQDYLCATYPGALFPNNFREVEKYSHGGYYLITIENNIQHVEFKPLVVMEHQALKIEIKHQTPLEITQKIEQLIAQTECKRKIITLRVSGIIKSGRVTDINFKKITEEIYRKGAYFVMKNTTKLVSEEFEEIATAQADPKVVEEKIIKEHSGQSKIFSVEEEVQLIKTLLNALNTTKQEGERISDFDVRIKTEMNSILKRENE